MREYIGLPLDIAVTKATESGFSVICACCDSDKQKEWDTQIVVQAILKGNTLKLVSSKFLLRKEQYGQ